MQSVHRMESLSVVEHSGNSQAPDARGQGFGNGILLVL
jgi:hypothetical protein